MVDDIVPQRAAPLGGSSRPLPQRRAAEAYDRIREMIIEGRFDSGTALTEAELVRQLGMSRTPIREALHRLEASNYLRAVPGVGFAIIELSERDIINVYRVRAVLEGLAAEDAADRVTRTDIARLEDLYDEMDKARANKDDAALALLNSRFHHTIAEAGRNTYVLAMLEDIREVFERFRGRAIANPARRDDAHDEHGEMIAALKDRDSDRARRLAISHVHRALELRRASTGSAEATTL